jgi:hypothetical protein
MYEHVLCIGNCLVNGCLYISGCGLWDWLASLTNYLLHIHMPLIPEYGCPSQADIFEEAKPWACSILPLHSLQPDPVVIRRVSA